MVSSMSWFPNQNGPSWLRRFCTSILRCGPIPKHVAFIMDGNRRFATKNSIARAEGHLKGFDKLAETLQWCRDLGITEVTVYAFSIENFKRSRDEIDCLMELARQKFARLLEEKEKLHEHGVCVRVRGDLKLLPLDIQKLVAEVMDVTKHNARSTLNVCFAYTSRSEICAAMKLLAEGVEKGLILDSDISEDLFERCLYACGSNPDLLVRTSGEVRLSDFLLWQSSFAVLSFVRVLWPDFTIWHLYAAVLRYQTNYAAVQKAKEKMTAERLAEQRESDRMCAAGVPDTPTGHEADSAGHTDTRTDEYCRERCVRVSGFMDFVERERAEFVANLGMFRNIDGVKS